ncbi:hypothetical protein D3C84_496830 [compost metagenome]
MYSVQASNLKLSYHSSIEFFGSRKPLPFFMVLNTLESHCNDMFRQRDGLSLFYQALCRTTEIQVENEDDERLCHKFVDNFNAMCAPRDPFEPHYMAPFDAALKAALELVGRIRGGHITLDSARA